jgi:hypothetical protein
MRFLGSFIITIIALTFVSCSTNCTVYGKSLAYKVDSMLIYDKITSDEFKSLKVQCKDKLNYVYENNLIELNLKSYSKKIIFEGTLLEGINFSDTLNKYTNSKTYINPIPPNYSTANGQSINSLFTDQKLINYWINNDSIYLFVKASTPSIEGNKVVSGTSKFLLVYYKNKIVLVKPLICPFESITIEDAGVYFDNGIFYFSTLPILFEDSIASFTKNLPDLIVSYTITSNQFSIVNLKMTKNDLDEYIKYMRNSGQNYCTYINIALTFKYNNQLCFSDSKNIYYAANLSSPIISENIVNTTSDVITALPTMNISLGDVLLFYKGNRNSIDGKITMTLNAINSCNGEILRSNEIDFNNKCSNVAIDHDCAYYFVNRDDQLYLFKWTLVK